MPIYEFLCPQCGQKLTQLCKMGESGENLTCPQCGKQGVEKRISAFSSPGAKGGKSCSPGCGGNCSGCH